MKTESLEDSFDFVTPNASRAVPDGLPKFRSIDNGIEVKYEALFRPKP